MMAIVTTGNGFTMAGKYDLRIKGKKATPANPEEVEILGIHGDLCYKVDNKGKYVVDVKQLGRDFRFQAMMRPKVRKPVYHWVLTWKVGETISDEEMKTRAEEFMESMGFSNTQYIIIRHKKDNQHCHIIANIVDNDGNRISTEDLVDRAHFVARMITKVYGYAWGEEAKKETIERAHKSHDKARYTIEPTVKAAVAKAKDILDLPELLQPSGIGCIIKYSNAGRPVGISFSVEMDGQLHTFKGSDLDRRLSAGKITKTIEDRVAREEANRVTALEELADRQEQAKPKITFDFKAARQQNNTFAASSSAKSTTIAIPSRNVVDVYTILLSARDKDSLELALLDRKIVMEPIKDRFGGVSDFKVTLARDGRVVMASSLVSEDRMRQMLDKWETLTGEVSAFTIESQRKLADNCKKRDIGKYTKQPGQRQAPLHSQGESRGEGKGYGGRGI